MKQTLLRIGAAWLAILLLITTVPIAFAESANAATALPITSQTIVNTINGPEKVLTAKQYFSGDTVTVPEPDEVTYLEEQSDVVLAFRSYMLDRTEVFMLYIKHETEIADFETYLETLWTACFAETDNAAGGDYLYHSWQTRRYGGAYQYFEDGVYYAVKLMLTYRTSAAQEAEFDAELEETIDEFAFTNETTEIQKANAIYNFITETVDYDYENLSDEEYLLKHTAYAALMHKTAVCEGYAMLFYRLAEECDLDARIITGVATASGEPHAWNIVKLGSVYYYLDATWDAGQTQYGYYLMGTEDFLGHTAEETFTASEWKNTYPVPPTGYETGLQESGNFQYSLSGGNATITAYNGSAEWVTIPSTIDNYSVVGIDSGAFFEKQTLKTLVLSEGITFMNPLAVERCFNLTAIHYPSTLSLSSHGRTSATDCPTNCYNLATITVAEDNPYIKVVDGVLYSADGKTLLHYPAKRPNKSYTVLEGCEEIGNSAFNWNDLLESVSIPDTVTFLGYWSFCACYNLKTANIPASCEFMGNFVFTNTSLTQLHIPAALTEILSDAFGHECPIETITVDPANPVYRMVNGALCTDTTLVKYAIGGEQTEYTVPEGITYIDTFAFQRADKLTKINLPSTLVEINNSAFEYCSNLTHVEIPSGTTTLGNFVFSYCPRLISIIIPASVTEIDRDLVFNNNNTTIYGVEGSYAQTYAQNYSQINEDGMGIALSFKLKDQFICTNGHNVVYDELGRDSGGVYHQYRCTNCGDGGQKITEPYRSMDDVDFSIEFTSAPYTGEEIRPDFTLTYQGEPLVEGVDYTYWYDNNTNPGTASLYIEDLCWPRGTGMYQGSRYKEFTITSFDLSDKEPVLSYTTIEFNGQPNTPTVTIEGLTEGVDFEVNNPGGGYSPGTYTFTIDGIGGYTGQIVRSFTVTPRDIALADVFLTQDLFPYTGEANTPMAILVYKGTEHMQETVDYTVSYQNNVNPGTATVIITGVGVYTGTIHKTFTIYEPLKTPGVVTGLTLTAKGNQITAMWDAVEGATNYFVTNTETGSVDVTGTSYTFKSLAYGKKYGVFIQAYATDGNNYLWGDACEAKFAYTAPTAPKVTVVNTASGITASWKKITGATGYYVYRRQSSGGKWSSWKKLKTTTALSYTDTTAGAGVTYQYYAQAYNNNATSSYTAVSIIRLTQPAVTAANAASGITASWKKVAGAKGYYVQRRQYSGGKWSGWTKLKTTTALSYTDTTAKAGVTYQYTACAYNGSYQSSYVGTSIVRLTQPAVTAANAASGITASWKKVAGAKGYIVYRRQYSSGKWSGWTKLKTTTALSYTDTTAGAGVTYQYYAQAYNNNATSSYTAVSIIRLTQPAVTAANAASGITASWKKVAGAKGYIVYRRQSSGGKWSGWKKLKTTAALSYTDKTAKAGVTYQYTARAYNSSYQSSFVGKTIRRLTQPTVKAAKVSNGIKVNWNKSTGASGYYIYRRQYSKGKWSGWQKIKTTAALNYTDKSAKKGVRYQYAVYAYYSSYQSSSKASATVKR